MILILIRIKNKFEIIYNFYHTSSKILLLLERLLKRIYLIFYSRRFYDRKLIIGDINDKFFGHGWETVDWGRADHIIDLSNDPLILPFKDNSIQLIYSSHLIEHLDDLACNRLYGECFRILKKGGMLRIVAPDGNYFIESYKRDKKAFFVDEYGIGVGRTYYEEVAMCVYKYNLDRRLLKTHNLLAAIFCCYHDLPNDAPIFDKNEVEEKLKNYSKEEFIQYCCSHYDKKRLGGHLNGHYSQKVINHLKKYNFSEIYESSFRGSKNKELRENPNIDLLIRKNISFYVEAVK